MRFRTNHYIIHAMFFGLCAAMDDALNQSYLANHEWETIPPMWNDMASSGTPVGSLHHINDVSAASSLSHRQEIHHENVVSGQHYPLDSSGMAVGSRNNVPDFLSEFDSENHGVGGFQMRGRPDHTIHQSISQAKGTPFVHSGINSVSGAALSGIRKRKGRGSETALLSPTTTSIQLESIQGPATDGSSVKTLSRVHFRKKEGKRRGSARQSPLVDLTAISDEEKHGSINNRIKTTASSKFLLNSLANRAHSLFVSSAIRDILQRR
ncbi:uncharacterized protein PGTG_19549 [Puccinia graminis f. sp. tritici CRL 75-36-700-3]|uniref:Uncharacterized protein n=1 Tax=Puccinia graminis f. sp. tritici (strain CRL 75-36-700-3 / race SCCL) TaxID=418459 RepID=E3LAH8_PUCGT|nr:uncharacterized protein PGTG_19549 [Puccinia graminis f. sp. tritici CRL 75-36-700-3]EFP93553.1 hypothetical protein PGTG_19549 [Puccinia graminis f. sp. tritici CRL 75-36-700-3]